MEIRTLRYFLAVTRGESMIRAAEQLHVTQPILSKQMKPLKRELESTLSTRRPPFTALTKKGRLLRRRVKDLVAMADRITDEFLEFDDVLGGDLYPSLAESHQVRFPAYEIKRLEEDCPGVQYHITSGDTRQVTEKLDKGLLDFAALMEEPDTT